MQTILEPVARELIKKELSPELFMKKPNFGNRSIYVVNAQNAPNTMLEIGRLREESFRNAGGGTGKNVDIDEFDTMEVPYEQLIVWDIDEEEIVGGYRFIKGDKVQFNAEKKPMLSTSEIFEFSDTFIEKYLPFTVELGRSFIQDKYQFSKDSRKGLFSLDNLWDGLGGLVTSNPEIKYFFGKITMYTDYNKTARDILLYYMNSYFADNERIVYPTRPLSYETSEVELKSIFAGQNLDEAFKTLNSKVKELGENIPPLFSSYIKLSPTMKTFGTAINPHFGNVEETGILIKIDDIYAEKKARHVGVPK